MFEITNPLGSGKGKHMLLGVYCTIANLYPHHRSKIDTFQLAILCKEGLLAKRISTFKSRFKNLETQGVNLGFGENMRGSVLCIMGDNLGSHWLGGFCTNFNGAYFCRYCTITCQEFLSNCCELGCERNTASYQQAIAKLNGTRTIEHYQGQKADSIFNQLPFFMLVLQFNRFFLCMTFFTDVEH